MSLVAAADEDIALGKIMSFQQEAFLCTLPDAIVPTSEKLTLLSSLATSILEHEMKTFYLSLITKIYEASTAKENAINLISLKKSHECFENIETGKPSASFLQTLESKIKTSLTDLDAKLEDAKANYGEVEVWDAIQAQIDYHSTTSSLDFTVKTLDAALEENKSSTNQKIRTLFKRVRTSLFNADVDVLSESLTKTKEIIDKGGDWEKRNRFAVLSGLSSIMKRELDKASGLFLKTVKTFTSYDVISYDDFARYTCILAMLNLNRQDLKKKIIECPDLVTTLNEFPALKTYITSFYEGRYAQFFRSLLDISDFLQKDRFLAPHRNFIIKEMRVRVYNQYLAAYKSVMLTSMATSFGVSTGFIDAELCKFIATGRVNAKIDRVNGIVETSKPDGKNAAYQKVIEKGDILLNDIQKLTRVIQS